MARGCSGTGHADGDRGPFGFVGGTSPMSDPGVSVTCNPARGR